MKMTYIISSTDGINSSLAKYSAVNFGIGIDFGHILCTKIGLARTPNNQDLIWIGHAVNKSTVISDKCTSPNHLGIARVVYDNLDDRHKFYVTKNTFGYEEKIDMWTQGYISYNGQTEIYYYTHYYWTVD